MSLQLHTESTTCRLRCIPGATLRELLATQEVLTVKLTFQEHRDLDLSNFV